MTDKKQGIMQEKDRSYRYLDLVMALFVTVLITSNIASSAKIIDWGVSLFGVRLSFDGGTILFPISYIFGDVLTEVYGFKRSRRVIWTGFGALAMSAAVLSIVGKLPGEVAWEGYAGDTAFNAILGGMTSFGLVAASLTAYLMGEFSNSVILAIMKVFTKGRWLWMRTIGSTLVGEGVDSLVFIFMASLAGVSLASFTSLVLTNYIFKVTIEVIFTPATDRMVNSLKKAENEDYFDVGTKFSPV
jgi:uncharacterized integral membrane protein (TIGR00697 family)